MTPESAQLRSLTGRELTGPLVRAARGLLGISIEGLAQMSLLSVATIKRAEAEQGPVRITAANSERLVEVFARANVIFVDHGSLGQGVIWKAVE